MNTLIQDVRFALRTLAKERVFAGVAVLTLALGIGVNVVVFSVVSSMLLRPLPVRDGERLVTLATRLPQFEYETFISYQEYLDLNKLGDVFTGLTGYAVAPANMNAGEDAERIWLDLVAPNYFSTLGVKPLYGSVLEADVARVPGAGAQLVLNHAFWKRRFASDPSVVGRVIHLNGQPYTVVGVAPPSFTGTQFWGVIDAYVPLTMAEQLRSVSLQYRGDRNVHALGYLRPGVSLEQAQAVLETHVRGWEGAYGELYKGVTLSILPERSARPEPAVGRIMPRVSAAFLMLTAFVLSLACVNTIGLFVARSAARQGEMAIRRALGAPRGRLVGQVVTESLVIALPAGVLGLLLGHGVARALAAFSIPADMPIGALFDARLDWRIVALAAALSIVVGVVSGLVTGLRWLRLDVGRGLWQAGSTQTLRQRQGRLGLSLVAGQVATATVVLVCAALFVGSLARLRDVDLGFRTEGRLLASLDLSLAGYDEQRGQRFLEGLLDQVRALPAVRSATATTLMPFGTRKTGGMVYATDVVRPPNDPGLFVFLGKTGADHLQAMGMTLLQGRDFTARDDRSGEAVVIVNKAAAARLWPGENPVGKSLGGLGTARRVVGVAGDAKLILASEDARPQVFMPLAQAPEMPVTLCVSAVGAPLTLAPTLRALVRSRDAQVPLYNVISFTRHVDGSIAYAPSRVGATFAAAAGGLGLLLALVGVGAAVWLQVRRRIPEIGLRLALGGQPWEVVLLVARRGLWAALLGIGLGVLLSLAVGRLLAGLLFGVSPRDPLAIVVVAGLLLVTTMAASLLPAHRAAKVDPAKALRCE